MEELSIGEVARRTGVPASALRYYEDAGLLPAPRRVSGRRRYDAEVLRRV
jgi:MerR family redox-sensitive transcriptional activator SoxR